MNTYVEIMQYLARTYFNNECYISKDKYVKNKGFSIHHYYYVEGDMKWNQFRKGEKGKAEYMQHLQRQIERDPSRFVLLKKIWHTTIDASPNQSSRIMGLSRISELQWEKLKEVVDKTARKTTKKTGRKSKK